jgi:hypothetical protein
MAHFVIDPTKKDDEHDKYEGSYSIRIEPKDAEVLGSLAKRLKIMLTDDVRDLIKTYIKLHKALQGDENDPKGVS